MVKKIQARARISHKLAKYVRATPVHLPSGSSAAQPSVSHLVLGGASKRKLRNNDKTWYPAEDEKNIFKRKRNQPRPSAGRRSIKAGSVVILLSGPHKGRRTVVLKSLPSGNLLVTGPYAINGVPLKRVNPAYVIATSTRVAIDGVNANVDQTHFKRQTRFTKNQLKNASQTRVKKSEAGQQAETAWKAQAKKIQQTVDGKLVQNIKKVEHLSGYLRTRFTLTNGVNPHELRF